jgi:putative ABC transport system permease protein
VAIAVLALGLGLALSTTMFAVLDAVVNPPQPYANADRLFELHIWAGPREKLTAHDVYRAVVGQSHSFDAIVPSRDATVPIEMGSTVGDLLVRYVPPRWFGVVGLPPALGRPFTAADGDGVVVLSHWLWKRLHGWRRSVVGARVMIGDRSYAVVGVMSRRASPTTGPAAWLPLEPAEEERATGRPQVRLRPGVTVEQARAELQALGNSLTARFGTHRYAYGIGMGSVVQERDEVRDIHRAMVGAALAVLLIACVNLAQLMLARAMAKRRELALRMALGARRPAAVRVMLAEAAVIVVAGVVLGAVLTVWGADLLESHMPTEVSWVGILQPQLNWRVFALAALAVTVAGALFGLAPAAQVVSKVSLNEPLKDAAGTTTGRNHARYNPLVMVEVGLALVLLMGGALLLRTVHQLKAQTYNFDTTTLLTARVTMPSRLRDSTPPPDPRQILSAVMAVRGVRDAALQGAREAPGHAVTAELSEDSTRLVVAAGYPVVSPSFLRVQGLPVLKGRDFDPGDAAGYGVAVLSAVAAARLYPRSDPVGRMLKLGGPASRAPWVRIVGVARTPMLAKASDEIAEPVFWITQPITPARVTTLLVRAATPDPRVAWHVQRALQVLAPRSSVLVAGFTEARDRDIVSRKFLAEVFVGMGVVGLALAALGLYGVLTYAVTRRMREFAVRIALGAEERAMRQMVLHDGFVMLLAGIGVGAFGALGAAFLLQAVLVEVYPVDAISLVAAEALLIGVGLAAALAPAHRAMRADPVEILRAT